MWKDVKMFVISSNILLQNCKKINNISTSKLKICNMQDNQGKEGGRINYNWKKSGKMYAHSIKIIVYNETKFHTSS